MGVIELIINYFIFYRNKLQQNRTETEDRIRDSEDVNENLKCQLTTMTQHLVDTEEELNLSKVELQNCRLEIDVRMLLGIEFIYIRNRDWIFK